MEERCDLVIVGGGIVGLATAMALTEQTPAKIVLIEAEGRLARHQTGNNSGVIHSGLYYKPGSLKARNCWEGRKKLIAFCRLEGIPFEQCGKLVVAVRKEEVPLLEDLERRGQANGLSGLRRLSPAQIKDHEPYAAGIDALHVPETGIVDYVSVAEAFARKVRQSGGCIETGRRFLGLERRPDQLVVKTDEGPLLSRFLINCGGLQCDRIARKCGLSPAIRIVPFRGEYYKLSPRGRFLVKNPIYPVPNPAFPFLGVHFTRLIGGGVEAGPNAVLAFCREGYKKTDFSLKDTLDTLTYTGFWRLAARYWKTGLGEMHRSASKAAFARALQHLIPSVSAADLAPGGAGVRSQALSPEGRLLDDFHIAGDRRTIHVLNAPSPAATASMSIGSIIANMAARRFGVGSSSAIRRR
ncbi:MAG: L-2-hydroxyglutarate oxidase [Desulfobacterales bacterium]|jgi:L-2-hydroxyglutarate oxidase